MLLRAWIFFCATMVAGGWFLSLFRGLNILNYSLLVFFFTTVLLHFRKDWAVEARSTFPRKLARLLSLRRALPGLFALLALLVLVKSCIVLPCHGDAMNYRIPRLLHWIYAGQWHWIDGQDPRFNTRGTVWEWLALPLLLGTNSDRLLFLPSFACLLLFPGVVFQVWRAWGVPSRMAWLWMWLLPTGFCYLLQAGNPSNDILVAFFALAAFAFLARGHKTTPLDLLCAALSMALSTGTKLTVLPLAVLWALIFFPILRRTLARPLAIVGGAVWSGTVSGLSTLLHNFEYAGDPVGLSLEPEVARSSPYWERLEGNSLLLPLHNLAMPWMHADWFMFGLWRSNFARLIDQNFEAGALYFFPFFAIQQEGLGIFVVLAGGLLFVATFSRRYLAQARRRLTPGRMVCHIGSWFLFLLFMITSTAAEPARLVSGYYPFVLAGPFLGSRFPPRFGIFYLRPLVGAALLIAMGCELWFVENPLVSTSPLCTGRCDTDEQAYQYFIKAVPPDEQTVGLIRVWNEWETFAWKPYGTRFVRQLPFDVSNDQLKSENLHYVLITQYDLQIHRETIEDWTSRHHAKIVGGFLTPEYPVTPLGYYIVNF